MMISAVRAFCVLSPEGEDMSKPQIEARGLVPGTLVQDKTGAAALGVSRTKFWALVKDGLLTPVRFGNRCTRFKSDEILALTK